MEMKTYPKFDDEWSESKIIEVKANREFHLGEGYWFAVPKDSPVVPKTGMIARMYGKGFGYSVRGLFLDGKCVYYRTPDEEVEQHRQWVAEKEAKDRAEFEEHRESIDVRYDTLPKCFRKRIDKFRDNNPEFRWKYEDYELFVCEEAIKIAKALKTDKAIVDWKEGNPFSDSRVDISRDHSGNTFGFAVLLARLFAQGEEEKIIGAHGALAPLVGSKEYGCIWDGALTKRDFEKRP